MIFLKSKKNKGFTLLEAVLYLAISGIVLYFISGFAFNVIFNKSKIDTLQNTNQEASSVLDQISNTIGDSVGINNISN